MEKSIFKIPKSTSTGIYMLYNLDNHKVYIGQTHNFHARALNHSNNLKSNIHANKNMQNDFNKGCEFAFVILEDMGSESNKRTILLKEKQYLYAFKYKGIKLYNHESLEQLRGNLFFDMVFPTIDSLHLKLYKQFGCQMITLSRCKSDTLKGKFGC